MMKIFETLTEAISDLKARGYTRDFSLQETSLVCSSTSSGLSPEDFEITET